MTPSFDKIHNQFKINGYHYDREGLAEVAYSFIKEGKAYEKSIGDFLLDWLSSNNEIQVFTSGSTGKPKQISLKKEHMVNSAIATGDFFGLKPGNTVLLCLPANYIAGKMMLIRAIILGLEIDFVEPNLEPLKGIKKCYDFVPMIPAQVEKSLIQIEQIKTVIIGGAPISSELSSKLLGKNTEFYSTYGMTETVTHVAVKKLNQLKPGESFNFKTLPNVSVCADERSCLVIDAPLVSDKRIVTNDVVNIISESEFEWLGRFDNVINSGGIKLFPEKLEDKLSQVIKERFFIASEPHESFGEQLILVIESDEADANELLSSIRGIKTIEGYEIPKKIYSISKFVESENGKILRHDTLQSI
ncbi:AMP-binding protein [Zhouia amylolytica]|uniref:AMP-binding protein n=1 Tax=Zhouia amylolytica TaxID=376730 RepID=UPI0020CD56B3|nr:AMP-binding protein [Zhouia amylolytica]MCQ0112410.1 AMP-binding protein [Zhouia amylolytica]